MILFTFDLTSGLNCISGSFSSGMIIRRRKSLRCSTISCPSEELSGLLDRDVSVAFTFAAACLAPSGARVPYSPGYSQEDY